MHSTVYIDYYYHLFLNFLNENSSFFISWKNSFHFLILKLYHNIAYVFPSYIAPFLLVSQTGWGSLRIKENYWGAIKHALNKFEEWPGTITIFCVVVSVRKCD